MRLSTTKLNLTKFNQKMSKCAFKSHLQENLNIFFFEKKKKKNSALKLLCSNNFVCFFSFFFLYYFMYYLVHNRKCLQIVLRVQQSEHNIFLSIAFMICADLSFASWTTKNFAFSSILFYLEIYNKWLLLFLRQISSLFFIMVTPQ